MSLPEQYYPLLDAARLGDPEALGQLLRVCQPDIRRYAYRHCLVSNVDDAVQETLLIISRRLASLRAITAFSSWLFTVVRRECRRLERHIYRLEPYDDDKMERWLVSHSDEAIRLDLVQAMESLPFAYREVIMLRDFYGLSIRELAERIGQTTAATKSRLHRARQAIREYLLA